MFDMPYEYELSSCIEDRPSDKDIEEDDICICGDEDCQRLNFVRDWPDEPDVDELQENQDFAQDDCLYDSCDDYGDDFE